MIGLDVTSINSIEGLLLSNIINGFATLSIYAKHLLYYFTGFEIIFCGFAWIFYQSQIAERLFGQLLKIGLVLFLVDHFNVILNSVLSSLMIIGVHLSQSPGIENILLNPGLIWSYGYNFSISLLQAAASADGFALPMILMFIGFGILCTIALFGIQIFVQVIAFYLVAAMSLLFIPLSVFSPLQDFLSQSVKNVLQAAVRLMVQMILVSAAVSVWSVMKLQSYDHTMNINAPLGFLFTGLLFVLASAYLPRLAAQVIGGISFASRSSQTITPSVAVAVTNTTGLTGISNQPTAGAVLTTTQAANMMMPTAATNAAMVTQPPVSVTAYTQTIKGDFLAKQRGATSLNFEQKKSLEAQHKEDIKKIKQAFYEVLSETVKS